MYGINNYMEASPSIQHIEISKLFFDPENPRLPREVNGSDDEEVLDFLISNANVDDLMKSIGSQGYFPGEPLLVVPKDLNSKDYIVVEGNRRLGALKLLAGATPPRKAGTIKAIIEEVDKEIIEVPCIVFESRDNILGYLGYRHITGIKEWDHLAKARYLKQLYDNYFLNSTADNNEVYRVLAKNIGSKANHVANLLGALEFIEYADEHDILKDLGKKPDDLYFSLLTTALNSSSIKSYVYGSDDVDNRNLIDSSVRNLLFWLYGSKNKESIIGESRNIVKLSKVLSNEASKTYFMSNIAESNVLDVSYNISGGMLEGFESLLTTVSENIKSLKVIYFDIDDQLTELHFNRIDKIFKEFKMLHTSIENSFKSGSED